MGDLCVTIVLFVMVLFVNNVLKKGRVCRLNCRRCCRMTLSLFIFMFFALILFFVPVSIVLCFFVNVRAWGFVQMVAFKAGFGGMIALILSPFACHIFLMNE